MTQSDTACTYNNISARMWSALWLSCETMKMHKRPLPHIDAHWCYHTVKGRLPLDKRFVRGYSLRVSWRHHLTHTYSPLSWLIWPSLRVTGRVHRPCFQPIFHRSPVRREKTSGYQNTSAQCPQLDSIRCHVCNYLQKHNKIWPSAQFNNNNNMVVLLNLNEYKFIP